PAVQVDAEEDRLEEEREALERERQADDPARDVGEARPQQAELEGDDRAGDGADGEEDRERLRPAPGEGAPGRVAGPQVEALGGEHHDRQADAEDREGEVEGQGRAHLRPARDEVVHGVRNRWRSTYPATWWPRSSPATS